jgi:conjugal transfer ATP-binding protein TraC
MTSLMKLAESPLAHQLPYWWVGDSAYVMHDGTLALGWRLRGLDVSTTTDDAINTLARQLRGALNALPVGTTVQFLRHVTTVSAATWDAYGAQLRTTSPILRELRQRTARHLRAQAFRVSETFLLISKPRALGKFGIRNATGLSRAVNAFSRKKDPATLTREGHQLALEELLQSTNAFVRALSSCSVAPNNLGLARLDDAALAELAFRFLNTNRHARGDRPVLIDDAPPTHLPAEQQKLYRSLSLREQLVNSGLSWSADTLFLDDPLRPHRVLGLKALPPQTTASLMRQANQIAFPHWLSVSVSVPDSEAKYASIEKRRNRAKVAASGFARDIRADAQATELEEAMRGMVERDQRVYGVTAHVLFGADDLLELDRRAASVVDVFRAAHMPVATEQQAQFFAWRGMLPGNSHVAPHTRTCLTDNAADLLPIYESWSGDPRPLFVVSHRTGEPFHFDLADPKRINWNSLVFGGSGGGKSFLVLSLANSSMLAQGSDLIVVDVGGGELGSYYRLCKLLGGDFVDLSLDGRNAVNPFPDRSTLFLDLDGNVSTQPNPLRVQYLMNITAMLVTDTGAAQLGRVGEAVLLSAILATYQRLGDRTPIYDDLVATLERHGDDDEDRAQAKRMAKVLRATLAGPIGKLINQPSRVSTKSNFVVFDMKGLEALGDLASVMLLVVSSFIWNMIGKKRDRLAWLVYDECWAMMKYPAAAAVQSELYRTARKLNVGVISVTQKLDDFLATPSAKAILSNSTTSFLLKHKEDDVPRVAEVLGLNQREASLLADLRREKGRFSEVFVKQEAGSAVLRYSPSPWEYWLNTTDPGDRALEQQALAAASGDRLKALKQLVESHPHGAAGGARKARNA